MRFQKFSFGSIRIDGTTYEHDVVIDRGEVRKRKKRPSKKFREAFGHTPISPKGSSCTAAAGRRWLRAKVKDALIKQAALQAMFIQSLPRPKPLWLAGPARARSAKPARKP